MVRPTRDTSPTFKVGDKIFDRESTIRGLKQLKSIDVNEQIQKQLTLIENDTTNCSSTVAHDAQKLQHELSELKQIQLIDGREYASLTDQLTQATKQFKDRCLCINKNIEGETFP